MKLLPADLGEKWHVAIVRQRALGASMAWKRLAGKEEELNPTPRIGRLGKYWARGLDVSTDVVAKTLPMSSAKTSEAAWLSFGLALLPILLTHVLVAWTAPFWFLKVGMVALYALAAWITLIALPRRNFHELHQQAVAPEELQGILEAHVPGLGSHFGRMAGNVLRHIVGENYRVDAPDPLETAFLQLAYDVSKAENLSPSSETSLRETIRSLGLLICDLPPVADANNMEDVADLAEDARILADRAQSERDTIIAASLTRQAETLLARARAAQKTNLVLRQVRTLRQEFLTQIEAIRASLPALERRTAGGEAQFGVIADTVQRIAREAHSVADARTELDTFLTTTGRTATVLPESVVPEPRTYTTTTNDEVQTVRIGGGRAR